MSQKKHIPTTQETGGTGTTYEHYVGAAFLARLLIGGICPIFTSSRLRVEKVYFQTNLLGWETDDLLVICSSEGQEQKKLAIQSKRNFVLQSSDDDCKKTFHGFWKDFTNEDIFDPDNDALALATLPPSQRLSTGLRDLFDYARNSSDESDFAHRLSTVANKVVRNYSKSIRSIVCDGVSSEITDEQFWRFLKTLHLLNLDLFTDTSSEEANVKTMLGSVLRDPSDLAAPDGTWSELVNIAANAASGGKALTLPDLPQNMREKYRPGDYLELSRNSEQISELTEHYGKSNPSLDIGGSVVPRNEVGEILTIFDDIQRGNSVLVSGRSGIGKTSVISQTILEVEKRGWPILALRADRLPAASTPNELGISLGLTKSPVDALADLSGGDGCLLVIDQVDALSLDSRRNPEYFDCVNAVLEQAGSYPNMRVLLACRQFDIEDNLKLWAITKAAKVEQEISVEPFDEETVRSLVTDLGINPDTLSAQQMKLLSLPIHLKMLEFVSSVNQMDAMNLQSETQLYGKFWQEKRREMIDRLEDSGKDGSQVDSARNAVVELMNERQSLFAPTTRLEQHDDAISLMISENILVKDGPRVAFFHDSFFDYMFAQWFTLKSLDLASYILEQDQSLFMRSQVNRVLMQQRSESQRDFCVSVEAILTNEHIRTHLKSNVLSLLGSISEPSEQEWNIIEPLLETELSDNVLRLIRGSAGWFDLLLSIGVLESWMAGTDDKLRNAAVQLLQLIQKERPEQVAEILTPYVGRSEYWNNAIINVVIFSDFSASREHFEFVCETVRTGVFDPILVPSQNSVDVWFLIETFVDDQPTWACELIACCLDRMTEINREGDSTKLLLGVVYYRSRDVGVLNVAATKEPQEFTDLLLPQILTLIQSSTDSYGRPSFGRGFLHYCNSGAYYDFDDALVSALDTAMSVLAEKHPDEFLAYADQLCPLNYPVIQCVLMRGYAANSERFADVAVDYLLEDTSRFAAGAGNQKYWIARHAIEAISLHCSEGNFERLEKSVLGYYTDYELEGEDIRYKGWAQGILLGGLDSKRISPNGLTRLQELEVRFGEMISQQPEEPVGGFVESPISEDCARRMTDEEWLKEIEHYSSDSPSNDPNDLLVGGAPQLSEILVKLVKEDPSRFANLVYQVPDNANPVYFGAILRGIAEAGLGMDVVVDVCLRCHRIPGRPLGRYITQPLANVSVSPLPNEALELVAWYATEDPDPESVQAPTPQDLDHLGINSVRGTVALSVARLIFRDQEHFTFFAPYLDRMANDPSDAVRTCVVEVLVRVLKYDPKLAVELFLEFCDGEQSLLATEYVGMFFKYATRTHFMYLEPILSRMLESQDEAVAEAGARWICYASLLVEDAQIHAARCISGTKSHRLGAAEIYAANLKSSKHEAVCEKNLAKFFSDPEPEVRRVAAGCFSNFKGRELRNHQNLIKKFIASPAFEDEHEPFFWALEESTATMNEVILLASERVFELMGKDTGDVRGAAVRTSGRIAKLIVRVLDNSSNNSEKERCLNIVDEMERYGLYGMDEIRQRYDRW